jgi:hypothetical protein
MVNETQSTTGHPYWTDCYETARLPKEQGGGGCSDEGAKKVADIASAKLNNIVVNDSN